MRRNDFRHGLGFRCIRQPVQLQQDDAAHTEALANNHFAEISILGDQNANISLAGVQNFIIGSARPCLGYGNYVVAFVAKARDHEAGNILIRKKAHHSAASTVSCCM